MSVHQHDGISRSVKEDHKSAVKASLTKQISWLRDCSRQYFIIIVLILLWELLPQFELVDPFLLPPFSEVMESWAKMLASGEMFRHFYVSILRVLAGFMIGIGIAALLGVFMGWYKGFEEIIDPLLQACRSSSAIAVYPIFLLLFGVGEQAKIAIISWGAIWPTLLSTTAGVRQVDPVLIKAAKSMGASDLTLLLKVVIPSAVPHIATGIRLSAAHSLLVLVVAEMIGSHAGLGFSIFYFQEHYAIREMYAMLITIATAGVFVNYLLSLLEKRLTVWKEKIVAD